MLDWLTGAGHRRGIKVIDGLTRRCGSQEGNALASAAGSASPAIRASGSSPSRSSSGSGRTAAGTATRRQPATAPRSTSRCRRCGACTSTPSRPGIATRRRPPTGPPSSSSSTASSGGSRTASRSTRRSRPCTTRRSGTTTCCRRSSCSRGWAWPATPGRGRGCRRRGAAAPERPLARPADAGGSNPALREATSRSSTGASAANEMLTLNALRVLKAAAEAQERPSSEAGDELGENEVSAGIASSRERPSAASSASSRARSAPCSRERSRRRRARRPRAGRASRARRRTRATRLLACRHLGGPERDPDRRREERAGLEPVQRRDVGGVARDVAVLAADHAERRLGELAGDGRRRVREREPEGLRQQRVAGEERRRLAEGDVRARPAAALVVVVERRQVVVDEREGVHELDRGGRGQAPLRLGAGRLADGERQDGPDPLPARLQRIAQHGLEPAELRRERELLEVALDERAQLVRAAGHSLRGCVPWRAPPRRPWRSRRAR